MMAAKRDLPGTARIGKVWTFDVDKLSLFLAAGGTASVPPPDTRRVPMAPSRPVERIPTERSIGKAYERAMSEALGKPAPGSSKRLKRRGGARFRKAKP